MNEGMPEADTVKREGIMKTHATVVGLLLVALVSSTPASAQLARTDAIWARSAPPGSITLDGNLNEAVWATAESWRVHYNYDLLHPVFGTQGIPGSGWKNEGGFPPNGGTSDSTNATLKFLVVGNQLYLGATVPDLSVGGGGGFNYFDGFLMNFKDHSLFQGFPKPVMEYLYSWWYPREAGVPFFQCAQSIDSAAGNPPIFKGRWAPDPVCDPGTGQVVARTANQIAQWDARTVVNGLTNSDLVPDVGYTVEMRFNLDSLGYDVTKAAGDTIEWNLSIYDTDNWWKVPLGFDLSRNRTWWASPWGNVAEQDEVRIYAKPSVTTTSGALPAIDPDFRIPTTSMAVPTIDGNIGDAVWGLAPSFDLRWNDNALRASYPSVGKYRSGQYQPRLAVNDPAPTPLPFVGDGADATVKYFFKGDFLYMAFDARDIRVESNQGEDLWDGFTVSITNRSEMDPVDHNLAGKGLSFHVGSAGNAVAAKDLAPLVGIGGTVVKLLTKAGTTVDSSGISTDDTGYTAELAVNLTQLGYPAGLGDHTMFLGVTLHDHDMYAPPQGPLTDSYATRAWWFREREEQCCPAWTYLDPTYVFGTVGVGNGPVADGFSLLGNSPNPFHLLTNLGFTLGRQSDVVLEVFDLSGRLIHQQALGRFAAGNRQVPVRLPATRSGVYLYRLKVQEPVTGVLLATLSGKMMRLR
jgi:hypothetical protein